MAPAKKETEAPFAHYPGEDDEQTEAYVAGLRVELKLREQRGESDAAADVRAELARMGAA